MKPEDEPAVRSLVSDPGGLRFFDFDSRASCPSEAPLREEERAQYLRGLDEARRLLQRFPDQ
jgi:hypothetical protein